MKIAIIGTANTVREGDLLRIEKDYIFNKVNVIKPGHGIAGVVSPLSYYDSVPSRVVTEEFEDSTYVIAGKKESIFTFAEVIIPTDFSYKYFKEIKKGEITAIQK